MGLQRDESAAAEAILDAVLGSAAGEQEVIQGTVAFLWVAMDVPGIDKYKIQQVARLGAGLGGWLFARDLVLVIYKELPSMFGRTTTLYTK